MPGETEKTHERGANATASAMYVREMHLYIFCGGGLTIPMMDLVSLAGSSICMTPLEKTLEPWGMMSCAVSAAEPHWLISDSCTDQPCTLETS